MASTASPIFGLQLQGDGDNINAWGQLLNTLFQLLEQAAAGIEAITVNADVTLTNTNYVENQSRKAGFKLTGAGGFDIICPAKSRKYIVKNDCTADVTFTHNAGGTDIVVPAGKIKWVFTDGTDFFTAEEEDYLLMTGGTLSGLAEYNNDKSGSFTDRSLIDKAYADTKLAKAGGTLTGFLTLHADPTDDLHAVTKQYLHSVAMGAVSISQAWADITGKPTTVAGFGITDAYTESEVDSLLAAKQAASAALTALAAETQGEVGMAMLGLTQVVMSGDVNPAASGGMYYPDSTTSARSITLPAAPNDGDVIVVSDTKDSNCGTNNCTIARNGKTIKGSATDFVINQNNGWVWLAYDNDNNDWKVAAFG